MPGLPAAGAAAPRGSGAAETRARHIRPPSDPLDRTGLSRDAHWLCLPDPPELFALSAEPLSADPALVAPRSVLRHPAFALFWASRVFVSRSHAAVEAVTRAIAQADYWIAEDPERSGRFFADVVDGGLAAEEWRNAVARRRWGVIAASRELLAEQQAEADVLARHGIIERRLDLEEAALPFAFDLAS